MFTATGGPNAGVAPPIEAALVKVGGADGSPTVVQTTIAAAGTNLLGAAAAPTGQALALWMAPGNGGAYFAAVTTSGGNLHAGSPSPLPDFGEMSRVAFDGRGFLILGGSPCCPSPGLTAQRVGLDGVPVGGVLHVASNENAQVLFATVSTPKGAAVLWATENPSPSVHASLVTDDGALARDVVVTGAGRGWLTWTGDRLLYVEPNALGDAPPTTTLRDLGWFGEPAWETSVPGTADNLPAMASGKVYLSVSDSTAANSTHSVYAVTPGGGPGPVEKGLPAGSTLGEDGCGHLLIATVLPRQTGVPYENGSPWTLKVLGSSASLSVGSDLPYMYMNAGAFLAGASSAAFVWSETSMGSAAPSTARFATIGWH